MLFTTINSSPHPWVSSIWALNVLEPWLSSSIRCLWYWESKSAWFWSRFASLVAMLPLCVLIAFWHPSRVCWFELAMCGNDHCSCKQLDSWISGVALSWYGNQFEESCVDLPERVSDALKPRPNLDNHSGSNWRVLNSAFCSECRGGLRVCDTAR